MDYQDLFLTNAGRLNRQPFWIGVIILFVVNVVAGIIIALVLGNSSAGNLVASLVSLILLYPSVNIGIKRFHDRDKSGWWVLIWLIPIIGWLWYIIEAGCLPGTPGPNRYGPDPLKG
ncbi:MAG: DUF805 domain-containing protein [Methylovirgula sp.]|jgi:uncharacterized membrane protein YhaH (DUF805 family)